MPSSRRLRLFVPALLCALAVLAARPTDVTDHPSGSGVRLSAEVARLYEAAAATAREYEAVRRAAEEERAKARRIEKLLDRRRREIAVMHKDLGRIAREQYRKGGGLPLTVQMILADDPEKLMRGHRAVWQADAAVDHALEESRRAEERLTADEAKAATARQRLERRNAELAGLKQGIERKLRAARARLQGRADTSVAAGACPGAVRLDQPKADVTRAWVAPVERYRLSASFGSGGKRWTHRHTGQDFAVPVGTPVRAVGAGRVVRVACKGPFGIQAVVQHPGGYYTQYAHLAAVAVDQGDRVAPGQWIGQSGSTGNSSGPHLHFEVRVTPAMGSAVDPVPWLARRGVTL
ncbi:peptidase M23 [Streptomyces cyaneogriseus subsp. noncyanogenus]|uniref:Peptidase M23 n=1 Tax=Streptomyces cyaneogriseus subsp. noncyanogenus TaxID=477245 RepID=A0A0C5GEV7_9ACTN|nr:M23 family metallopeptidase [Streptomyces cyaneogriseus]AJP02891.1 peptidase M23 [Streptomyces cyaneogriseus subsp. noncyanogenus]